MSPVLLLHQVCLPAGCSIQLDQGWAAVIVRCIIPSIIIQDFTAEVNKQLCVICWFTCGWEHLDVNIPGVSNNVKLRCVYETHKQKSSFFSWAEMRSLSVWFILLPWNACFWTGEKKYKLDCFVVFFLLLRYTRLRI